ncbi:MAG: hypothetical protein HY000_21795 [Planctomycetes bacterium]|nr:hypothetical protein [Planctomycetota bacterium]
MTVHEAIELLLQEMPEDRQRQVLEFAQFVAWKEDAEAWRAFGRSQFAKAYGPDEPEYTEADIRTDLSS